MPAPLGNTPNPSDESASTASEQGGEKNDAEPAKTFTQEDIDKIVSKRINEINAKNEEKVKAAADAAREDERRKAKMTAEEKAKAELDEQRAEIEKAKHDIAIRENRATARELLQEKGISATLVDWVVDEDLDTTKEKITQLEKVFNEAVEASVNAKLKGNTPSDPAGNGGGKGGDKTSTYDLLYKK